MPAVQRTEKEHPHPVLTTTAKNVVKIARAQHAKKAVQKANAAKAKKKVPIAAKIAKAIAAKAALKSS